MLGRLRRKDAQAVEAIREQLTAADLRARSVLADAVAQMDSRLSTDLEQRIQLQESTQTTIDALEQSLTRSATEVAHALEQLANMCALVAERLEEERLDRHAFTEAIRRLTPSPSRQLNEPSRVLGGSIFASSSIAHDEISVVEDPEDPAVPASPADSPIETSAWATRVLERLANDDGREANHGRA
jgi:uncharacterized coiled-coil protein SlyX